MTEGIIRSLLNHPAEPIADIPRYLATQFARIARIRNKRYRVSEDKQRLKAEFDAKCKALDEEFKKVQTECKHEETNFQGDPAGGRDSHRECDICGKLL